MGDLLIQICRPAKAKRPSEVLKAVPVLLKQPTKRWTRFYVAEPIGRFPEISWGQFQRLVREIGYPRQVRPVQCSWLSLTLQTQSAESGTLLRGIRFPSDSEVFKALIG
jgi:hypothetical protein